MAPLRFSTRQLLLSVLWLCIGFALIGFSLRDWNLSLHSSDDWLANIQPGVRSAARSIGWVFVCLGIIALVATRARTRMLIFALLGVVPGLIAGVWIRNAVYSTLNGYERNEKVLIPYLAMAFTSLFSLVVAAANSKPFNAELRDDDRTSKLPDQ
jgi:hypothetical protein